MIIEIDNVELSFSNKKILHGIYLKAETGKVTGILGRNGCGKSSLLKIIFGTLKPKYKLIRIDGKPILNPLYIKRQINLLPQHQLLPSDLKIKSVFKLLGVDWPDFIIEFPSFAFYIDTKIKTLSGGERRVLECYLMLKSDSKIVLLDEPFSHIAPIYVEKIKAMIQKEKHTKIIIITDHYFNDVIESSDRLYLLKNGSSKHITNLEELEDYKYLNVGMLS